MEKCSWGDFFGGGLVNDACKFHSFDMVQISATLPKPPVKEAGKYSLSVAQMKRRCS